MSKRNKKESRPQSERSKGIITVILYIVIPTALQFLVGFSLKIFKDTTGIFNEDLFNDLLTFIPYIIATIIFVIIFRKTIKEDIKRITKKDVRLIIVISILVLILNYGSGAVLDMFDAPDANNEELVSGMFTTSVALTLIVTTLYGPIVEELAFRKGLDQIIKNDVIFFILTTLAFGIVHSATLRIIPFLIMGALCTVAYLKTDRNTVSSMIVHLINNFVVTLMMFIE